MIDVTDIFTQIKGYAGVCFPRKDADNKRVLDESCLQDALLSEIHDLISACPRIPHNPIPYEE